uniref:Uncharacterized protein n=1 Tax=Vespula pensylvanica TaxID=30213 RepID=A0A834PAV0_VESPE|nr:hypothetical protein H0235_002916 [Vespula pensylvanica]
MKIAIVVRNAGSSNSHSEAVDSQALRGIHLKSKHSRFNGETYGIAVDSAIPLRVSDSDSSGDDDGDGSTDGGGGDGGGHVRVS